MNFEFLLSNLQIAYPFQQNVTVHRFGADTEVSLTTAAARIRTVDQRDERLTLTNLYLESADGFVTFTEADIELTWQSSGDVIALSDTAGTAIAVVQQYGSWVVVEWYAPLDMSGQPDLAIKLIFPTSAIELNAGDSIIQITSATDDIVFHDSVISQGPNGIRRVYWKRGDTLELVADRGEEFIVQAGFNMSIEDATTTSATEGRNLTRVAIDAVPEAGFGKYLLCQGSEYLLTVNGVKANAHGELVLNPLECYWPSQEVDGEIEPQTEAHGITGTAQLKPNEVKIGNACGPCCSCDDYIATYTHLHTIWDRALAASARIYALNDQYAALVALYEGLIGECTSIGLSLVQTVTDRLLVVISLCNDTTSTLNNDPAAALLQFDLMFSLPGGVAASYMPGTGALGVAGTGHPLEPDSYTATTAMIEADLPVPPNATLFWAGIWELSGTLATNVIDITVLATDGDLPSPRSTTASITLT